MKYFLVDILNLDPRSNWVEKNNIPFQKMVTPGGINRQYSGLKYVNCYFDSTNISILEDVPKFIKVEDITEANINKGNVYTIFSDGGSFNNGKRDPDRPMIASSSTFIIKNGKEEIFNEKHVYDDSTNNYGEVMGGILGLEYIIKNISKNEKPLVIISSDSQYLMKGINSWLDSWIKRGWKNNEGKPTPNLEKWKFIKKCLDDTDNFKMILTCWVRGHSKISGNIYSEYNDKCDIQCNEALNILLEKYNLPLREV